MDATRVSVMRCKLELTCQHPRPRAHDKTFNHTMCNIYNQVCLQGVAVNFMRASAKVSECCECFTETGSIVSAARGLGLSARIGELHTWCWAGCSPDELGCPLPYLMWLHKHVQNHVLVRPTIQAKYQECVKPMYLSGPSYLLVPVPSSDFFLDT